MSDIKVTSQNIRDALLETDLPLIIERVTKQVLSGAPPPPQMPNNAPKDFSEAQFAKGVCAIPLWDGRKWSFGAICDGMPINDMRTGKMVTFDDYKEAMIQLNGWYLHSRSRVPS